jgi:hypothetical protein
MRAIGRTELRCIDRKHFRRHVGDLGSLLKRNTSKFEAYEMHIKEARRASQVQEEVIPISKQQKLAKAQNKN